MICFEKSPRMRNPKFPLGMETNNALYVFSSHVGKILFFYKKENVKQFKYFIMVIV